MPQGRQVAAWLAFSVEDTPGVAPISPAARGRTGAPMYSLAVWRIGRGESGRPEGPGRNMKSGAIPSGYVWCLLWVSGPARMHADTADPIQKGSRNATRTGVPSREY